MIGVWIALAIIALLLVVVVVGFNRLVRLRNEVDTGWANIDVQLKRRADLIPNLVEAVKGYAAHERGVFDSVTQARSALMSATTPAAAGQASCMTLPARIRLRRAVGIARAVSVNSKSKLMSVLVTPDW